jgi:hypothetical protein
MVFSLVALRRVLDAPLFGRRDHTGEKAARKDAGGPVGTDISWGRRVEVRLTAGKTHDPV